MDIVSKIAIVTLGITALTLIISPLAISRKRLLYLFRIIFSIITCYGILKVIAAYKGENLYVWNLEEYLDEGNLSIFYHKMLLKCIIWVFVSLTFFYVLLRFILNIYEKKLINFFKKELNNEKKVNTYLRGTLRGIKFRREITTPVQSEDVKEMTPIDVHYNLYAILNDIAFMIHFFVCLIICFSSYWHLFTIFIVILICIMLVILPYMKALTEYVETKIKLSEPIKKKSLPLKVRLKISRISRRSR